MINSVFGTDKNYYLLDILEKYKYVVKEKMMPECISDDIGDLNKKNSDEENFIEES